MNLYELRTDYWVLSFVTFALKTDFHTCNILLFLFKIGASPAQFLYHLQVSKLRVFFDLG